MTRILVVEDDSAIALGLEDDLTLEGYTVEVVRDGETALHPSCTAKMGTGADAVVDEAKTKDPVVRWAGIENLAIQGGTNPGYNGQMAGGIDISNAAYCWVKDVQTDGTIGGMHVSLTGTYRCVVRDGYFHHSANYGFGADCYGIVLRCGASENLVENNIVRWMNKPILFDVTGGGNVVAL